MAGVRVSKERAVRPRASRVGEGERVLYEKKAQFLNRKIILCFLLQKLYMFIVEIIGNTDE